MVGGGEVDRRGSGAEEGGGALESPYPASIEQAWRKYVVIAIWRRGRFDIR